MVRTHHEKGPHLPHKEFQLPRATRSTWTWFHRPGRDNDGRFFWSFWFFETFWNHQKLVSFLKILIKLCLLGRLLVGWKKVSPWGCPFSSPFLENVWKSRENVYIPGVSFSQFHMATFFACHGGEKTQSLLWFVLFCIPFLWHGKKSPVFQDTPMFSCDIPLIIIPWFTAEIPSANYCLHRRPIKCPSISHQIIKKTDPIKYPLVN